MNEELITNLMTGRYRLRGVGRRDQRSGAVHQRHDALGQRGGVHVQGELPAGGRSQALL